MKVKTDDLKQLLEYLDKELVEECELTFHTDSFSATSLLHEVSVKFNDIDKRICVITLFDSLLKRAPRLSKTMDLASRLKK